MSGDYDDVLPMCPPVSENFELPLLTVFAFLNDAFILESCAFNSQLAQ